MLSGWLWLSTRWCPFAYRTFLRWPLPRRCLMRSRSGDPDVWRVSIRFLGDLEEPHNMISHGTVEAPPSSTLHDLVQGIEHEGRLTSAAHGVEVIAYTSAPASSCMTARPLDREHTGMDGSSPSSSSRWSTYGAQPADVWQTCVSPCCVSHWEHACRLWTTSVSGCFCHTCASAFYAQQRNLAAGPWICRNCLLDYKGVRCRPFRRFVDHRLQWQRWPLMLLHLLFHQLLMKLIWPDLYRRISPAVCFGVGEPPLLSHLGV